MNAGPIAEASSLLDHATVEARDALGVALAVSWGFIVSTERNLRDAAVVAIAEASISLTSNLSFVVATLLREGAHLSLRASHMGIRPRVGDLWNEFFYALRITVGDTPKSGRMDCVSIDHLYLVVEAALLAILAATSASANRELRSYGSRLGV